MHEIHAVLCNAGFGVAQLVFLEEEDVSSPDSAEFFGVLGATSPSTVRIASAESAGDDESIGGGPFSVPTLYKVCFVLGTYGSPVI